MSNAPTNKRRRRRAAKPKKDGRPTLYRAQYATIALGFTVAGYTDAEMARYFGVSESTLSLWKVKHPKFSEAIRQGKEPANAEAAVTLFQKAVKGYSVPAVKIFQHEGETIEHHYREFYPPDSSLLMFFLKNRMPKVWRDKHEIGVTDPNGANAFDAMAVAVAQQIIKQQGL